MEKLPIEGLKDFARKMSEYSDPRFITPMHPTYFDRAMGLGLLEATDMPLVYRVVSSMSDKLFDGCLVCRDAYVPDNFYIKGKL